MMTTAKHTAADSARRVPSHISKDFEQSVVSYIDVLYAVAFNLTHDIEGAQLLVMETLDRVLRSRHTVSKANHKPWLLAMLRRTFLDTAPMRGLTGRLS